MQSKLFECVNLRPSSRQSIANLCRKILSPLQSRFIRSSSIELQRGFFHRERNIFAIDDLAVCVGRDLRNTGRIGIKIIPPRRFAVVGPHAVTTGAL